MRQLIFLMIALVMSSQIRVDVPLVTVDAVVSDANGRSVTNLTREDFSVFEDGRQQSIQSFSAVDSPYHIVLLIDRSRSMQSYWSLMLPAISRFVAQLKPQDRVSIGAFDERSRTVEVLLDWREVGGKESLAVAINPVVGNQWFTLQSGSTSFPLRLERNGTVTMQPIGPSVVSVRSPQKDLYAALDWMTQKLVSVNSRKGAIVFTDGRQPGAPTTAVGSGDYRHFRLRDPQDDDAFQKILGSIQKTSSPVYFVAVNTDLNPSDGRFSMEAMSAGLPVRLRLEQLTTTSGGRLLLPRRTEDTLEFYEQIGRDLGSSYTLSYSPNSSGSGSHRIEVRVRDSALKVRQSRESYTLPR